MADLLTKAKEDLQRFSQADFSVEMTVENPNPVQSVTIRAFASSHHLSIDPETGLPVNVRNTHVSISEQVLIDAGYTVRDTNGEVNMINHFVTYTNSAGQSKKFKINQTFPDETLGLIVCILGDYN